MASPILKSRIKYIDILFSIAVLCVVFGHANLAPDYENVNPYWYKVGRAFVYTFHMPLFFVISGFLAAHTYTKFVKFFRKRAERLLIPYIILSAIALIPKYALEVYTINKPPISILQFVIFLFHPWQNTISSYWFLPTLFIVSLLTPVYIWLSSTSTFRMIILIFMAVVTYKLPNGGPELLNIVGIFHYTFFYYIGICGYIYREVFEKNSNLLISAICFIFMTILFICFEGSSYMLNSLLAPIALFSLAIALQDKIEPIFFFMKHHYYQIFLLSWFVQRGVMVIHRATGVTFSFMFPVSLIGGIIIPIIIAGFVERYLPILRPIIGFSKTS